MSIGNIKGHFGRSRCLHLYREKAGTFPGRHVKFNTNFLHGAFMYELMLRHVSGLNLGHLQGACKFFLACAACASTYLAEILLIIKIFIIMIKCYSS